MSFDSLGLENSLLSAVKEKGYTIPTPIQKQAIPAILDGRDVLGGAQTGTGKTAAFTLPLLQLLNNRDLQGNHPKALVITPTRELAAQIQQSILAYGKYIDIVVTTIYGGVSFNPQIARLRRGVDIIVACPGRLLDLAKQENVDLSKIDILVLDEADRMLDMGFAREINSILRMLPKEKQTLLFSATYTADIKKMTNKLLRDPAKIELSPENQAADTIEQVIHPVKKVQKRELLSKLIRHQYWNRALVFTRTKHGAENLTKYLLKDGIKAKAIHGNKSQVARIYALDEFKRGDVEILVATDVAARGLDIHSLPHVVNFDMPQVPEDYVHRIGRTGRAGKDGIAISLVSGDEQKMLWSIERLLKKRITVQYIENYDFESEEELATAEVEKKIRNKKHSSRSRKKPASGNYGKNSDEKMKKKRAQKASTDESYDSRRKKKSAHTKGETDNKPSRKKKWNTTKKDGFSTEDGSRKKTKQNSNSTSKNTTKTTGKKISNKKRFESNKKNPKKRWQ